MFENRQQAGKLLAQLLKDKEDKKTIVCGITRGGVVVASEVAKLLQYPLYPIVVKKIGAPDNPELALGALTYDKTTFIDWGLVKRVGASQNYLNEQIEVKSADVNRLAVKFKHKQRIPVKGKNIILIDDGIATGATALAVIKYLNSRKVNKIILAVPVIATEVYKKLKAKVAELVALEVSNELSAVGQFYESFPQVSDEEVLTIIN